MAVRDSPAHGLGVFTSKAIAAGIVVERAAVLESLLDKRLPRCGMGWYCYGSLFGLRLLVHSLGRGRSAEQDDATGRAAARRRGDRTTVAGRVPRASFQLSKRGTNSKQLEPTSIQFNIDYL